MVLTRVHRTISNYGAGAVADYPFSFRGGILLSVKLTSSLKEYYDIGTSLESAKQGDTLVILGDALNSGYIIGQDPTGFIRVSAGDTWEWNHPYKEEILAAAIVIEKLGAFSFPIMPVGVLLGPFRVIVAWDPLHQVQHDLIVEAEFMAFDANLT